VTRRIRGTDRVYPVDRASDQKERKPSTVGKGGIKDEWLNTIRTPSDAERAKARAFLVDTDNADLIDVLGLAS